MAETLAQRQRTMRKVMLDVQAQKPFKEFSFEEQRILKECYDFGYFEGIVVDEMASGRITGEYRHAPRLTYAGLQFLESIESSAKNLEEGRAEDQQERKNGIQECRQIGMRFLKRFWALIGGLAVLVTLFGWPAIRKAISFLLSFFQ